MEMQSEQRIPAPQETVWAALNNTEILQAAMPGCESFEEVGDDQYTARVTTKVGPVKARFNFNVSLTEIDAPTSYVINGEGQGGAAGFAKGSAAVSLASDGADTILRYQVQANVGGKLAQLGSRLIDGTAKKLADEFFTNFIELVAGDTASESEGNSASETIDASEEQGAAAPGNQHQNQPVWIYVVAGVIIAAMVFGAFV